MGSRFKIMLLNDNRTFTNLAGCRIISVPSQWNAEKIEAALREDDDEPWRAVAMQEFTAGDEQHSLTDAEEAALRPADEET
jgi:hypothetical protein